MSRATSSLQPRSNCYLVKSLLWLSNCLPSFLSNQIATLFPGCQNNDGMLPAQRNVPHSSLPSGLSKRHAVVEQLLYCSFTLKRADEGEHPVYLFPSRARTSFGTDGTTKTSPHWAHGISPYSTRQPCSVRFKHKDASGRALA